MLKVLDVVQEELWCEYPYEYTIVKHPQDGTLFQIYIFVDAVPLKWQRKIMVERLMELDSKTLRELSCRPTSTDGRILKECIHFTKFGKAVAIVFNKVGV